MHCVFTVSFHKSDIIGYHINKADSPVPTVINKPNKSAALHILCINVPTDPKVLKWTTETINVMGTEEEGAQLVASLDQKMKGM